METESGPPLAPSAERTHMPPGGDGESLEGKEHVYTKGDRFYILSGEIHSAKIFAGYTSMEFFADKDRYKTKE